MAFFDQQFIEFFRELAHNNHKSWFQENRKTYEHHVKRPFKEFIAHLISCIQDIDPEIKTEPKDCIFRINRDIRFAKDKAPYKLHTAAVIAEGGKKSSIPGYYIHLDHEKIIVGGGAYFMSKEELYALRLYISEHSEQFRVLLNETDFQKYFGEIKGEKNKVLPKELKPRAEEEPYLYNKQFYYMHELNADYILSEDLDQILMDRFEAMAPLNAFLKQGMQSSQN